MSLACAAEELRIVIFSFFLVTSLFTKKSYMYFDMVNNGICDVTRIEATDGYLEEKLTLLMWQLKGVEPSAIAKHVDDMVAIKK